MTHAPSADVPAVPFGRSTTRTATTCTATSSSVGASVGTADSARRLARWLGFVAAFGYWALFYGSAIPAFRTASGRAGDRLDQLLAALTAPELFLRGWCGGDWSRFSLLDRGPVLLVAGVILATAYALGALGLRALRLDERLDRLERSVFAFALGLQGLSLATFSVGWAGRLHDVALFWCGMATIVAAWGVMAVGDWRRRGRGERQGRSADDAVRPNSFANEATNEASNGTANDECFKYGWLWLAAPFVAWLALSACLPPWHFDARVYHLQAPREWLEQGRIGFMPHNVYANMPLGAEMQTLLAMALVRETSLGWWSGALAGKVVMAAYAPLTALALIALGRRFFSRSAGVAAAVIFMSTPWVAYVAPTGLNEAASAFYWLTAVYAACIWWTACRRTDDGRSRRWLVLAGLTTGAAIACKYPAVVFLAAPLGAAIGVRAYMSGGRTAAASSRWKNGVVCGAIFAIATLGSCGLWLGKNVALTGNPIYPLLAERFGGETRTPEKNEQWARAHSPPLDAQGRRFSATQWSDAAARVLWRSNGLSPLLIPGVVLAWIGAWRNRMTRRGVVGLTLGCLFVLAVWFAATHRFDRFLVPLLPVVAMLAGVGLATLVDASDRRWARAALVVGCGACFVTSSSRVMGDNRVLVELKQLRDDPALAVDGYFSRVNPAHRLLNAITPRPTKLLLVGDSRPYDLDVPTLYETCFDDCRLERLLRDRTPTEQRAALRGEQISHVWIAWQEIANLREPGEYGFCSWVTWPQVQQMAGPDGPLERVPLPLPAEFGELYRVRE